MTEQRLGGIAKMPKLVVVIKEVVESHDQISICKKQNTEWWKIMLEIVLFF